MATVGDITGDADAFRAAYPDWPHPRRYPPALRIGGFWYGEHDAVCAAAVIAEMDAGRQDDADRLITQARLNGLTRDDLEALCATFNTDTTPVGSAT